MRNQIYKASRRVSADLPLLQSFQQLGLREVAAVHRVPELQQVVALQLRG